MIEGKPKFWYSIPAEDAHYLETEAKIYFKKEFQKCPYYMRHKTILINPYYLKKKYPKMRIHKV